MDQNIKDTLSQHDAKLDAIFTSVEKTRKYFLIILWVTIAMVVLPILGLIIAVPLFLDVYTGAMNGLL